MTYTIKLFLTFFLACLLICPAYAANEEAQLLDRLIILAKEKKPEKAKKYLTAESHDIFDRLYKHDLTHLIPSDVKEVKQEKNGPYNYVWFTDDKHRNKSSILAFKNEDDLLKLDLPETFKIGFGKDWPKKINLIEQSYLLAKQYYGEEKSRQLLENLLQK